MAQPVEWVPKTKSRSISSNKGLFLHQKIYSKIIIELRKKKYLIF
jgi:hypothetical protein